MADVTEAWGRLARGDFQGAADLSRKLLATAPNDPAVLSCNAMSNWQLGADIGKCVADMRRAVMLAPQDAWIRHNLATVLASNGDIDAACESFTKAIELRPDDTEAFYGLSQNFKFTEETDLVRQMLAQYATGHLSQKAAEYVCFALAKVYSDLDRPIRAIHFCIEGNWLAQRAYDAERPRAELAELRRMVASGTFRHIAGSGVETAAPVFIVGMPRSGTTLVETILARHPEVYAGGEMLHMLNVERALLNWAKANRNYNAGPYELLRDIPTEYLTRNAHAVLGRVEAAAAGKAFSVFTDKLPENSQRIGLISLLFPKARFIYVRRNPLDCCISNLFQHFARGNGFAFRQDLLGERYRQVTETMHLWKRALNLQMLDVSYEALVSNPEPEIRRILSFAGLGWDPACLTPEQAKRSILTASQFQVKQPINRDSVDRWRKYEEWIQPLIQSLGGLEWIESEQREQAALAA
ncbi:MAG TPA: sulfotransferase [Devosiaceae bacterium]|nr:sulfotransferase [Devosiaceae bacterium]